MTKKGNSKGKGSKRSSSTKALTKPITAYELMERAGLLDWMKPNEKD